jgi:flagellar basal-body rod protein FlgF
MDAELIAYSRQRTLFQRLDATANNIANQNTSGFKQELAVYMKADNKIDGARNPNPNMAFSTNLSEGEFSATGRNLDVAIKGQGYFEVETPLGSRYTRAGSLQINSDNVLTTTQGYPVLGGGGAISLQPEDTDIVINETGEVFARTQNGLELRGELGVVKFADQTGLKKAGENLFSSEIAPEAALPKEDYKIAQGMVETSNVKGVEQMNQLVEINRDVAMTSKIIGDQSQLVRSAVSRIIKSE